MLIHRVFASVESLMPKGVEHLLSSKKSWLKVSVESLMPKGVEHYIWLNKTCFNGVC